MEDQNTSDIGFFFFNEDTSFALPSEKEIISCLTKALDDHDLVLGCINIIFCSDTHLLEMNKEYLNHDYFTDILTFPMSQDPLSGDLFISIDRVKDFAAQNNILFETELNRVMIHGMLHLVGYNDKSDEEVKEMRSQEDHYLSLI